MPTELPLWQKLVLLSICGAIGTLARYFLASWVQRVFDSDFPWGTLAVNTLGCFLFGFLWALAEQRQIITPTTRTILLVGFMGAFTTFSSFAFETSQLVVRGELLALAANLLLQNGLGILLVFAGIATGRWF